MERNRVHTLFKVDLKNSLTKKLMLHTVPHCLLSQNSIKTVIIANKSQKERDEFITEKVILELAGMTFGQPIHPSFYLQI